MGHGCHDCGSPNGCECIVDNKHRNYLPAELAAQLLECAPASVAPTPKERLKLERLIEEAAEVIQAATKILRFGRSTNPHNNVTSINALSTEVGQLLAAVDAVGSAGLLRADVQERAYTRKAAEYERGVRGELTK